MNNVFLFVFEIIGNSLQVCLNVMNQVSGTRVSNESTLDFDRTYDSW